MSRAGSALAALTVPVAREGGESVAGVRRPEGDATGQGR